MGWNETAAPYPEGATMHGLFAAQAARSPDAIALVFEDQHVTYRDLDERANLLAHHLAQRGVGPESRVGVSMPRSPGLVVAILGVLKAGGAWVPLDPAYPEDRRAFMIEDAGLALVLTGGETARAQSGRKDGEGDDATPLFDLLCVAFAPLRPRFGPGSRTAENAAYVIYTSGSTGRPKGVVVPHRGIGNVAEVQRRSLGAGPGSRVLALASTSFDASVWEMVMALLTGGTLVMAPEEALLPGPELLRTLADQAVTILTVVPSVLAAMPYAALPALATLVAAGEACPADLVDRWALQGARRFWNAYGPTEATICATMGECFAGGGKPPIGRPIANVQVFVLDARWARCRSGCPASCASAGVGVARGYLGPAGADRAERFEPVDARSARLYRDGGPRATAARRHDRFPRPHRPSGQAARLPRRARRDRGRPCGSTRAWPRPLRSCARIAPAIPGGWSRTS